MEVALTKDRVEATKGDDSSYSITATLSSPTTNILVPSFENAMPVGDSSRPDMEVSATWDRVEATKGDDSSYSFTSDPSMPITNILVPSLENAMSVGDSSWSAYVGGINERSGGGIKGADYEVAGLVPHRPRARWSVPAWPVLQLLQGVIE